jgi:heptosyltransferase-2
MASTTEPDTHILHFPFWLGDAIMALPFAHAWERFHDRESTILVIDPSLEEVLKRSQLTSERWLLKKNQRKELAGRLAQRTPNSVTLLTNSWGSYWPYVKTRVPNRIGFGGKWTKWFLTQRGEEEFRKLPQGERWFRLLKPEHRLEQVPYLSKLECSSAKISELLVFPGAKYGPAKQWDHGSYADVIKLAQLEGWKVSIMGTPEEQKDAEGIMSHLDAPVENACGKYKIGELLDRLKDLEGPVALANDSGAMHLLAAAGVPTLGLYFSTSSLNTPPAYGVYKCLEADIGCRPCYGRVCPKGHYDCRRQFEPKEVLRELKGLWKKYCNGD